MQKRLIALLLLFVSMTAGAYAWKSAQWRIAFTEPQNWKQHAVEEGVHFYPPDGSFGSIAFMCMESQSANMTKALAERRVAESKNMPIPKTKILGSRIVNINGQIMVKTTMVHELSDITYNTSYTTIRNHAEYTFMLSCDKKDFNRFSPILDKMVKSAKFL